MSNVRQIQPEQQFPIKTIILGAVVLLIFMFGSGLFNLQQGSTERISMAELHSYDPLAGLNSSSHTIVVCRLEHLKTIFPVKVQS